MSLRHPRPTGPRVYTDAQHGFVGYGQERARPRANGVQHWDTDGASGYSSSPLASLQGLGYNREELQLLSPRDDGPQQQQHRLPTAAKSSLLREVDQFVMSLPLGTSPGDVEIEEAVASRLYRSELAKAEAQAKLNEWVRVGSELKQIVQEQQAQLQELMAQQRGRPAGRAYAGGSLDRDAAQENLPPLGNLQHARGEQPRQAGSSTAGVGGGQLAASELQAELERTRRQLRQLQDSYDQVVDAQVHGKAGAAGTQHAQHSGPAAAAAAAATAELEAEVKALKLEVEHWKGVGEGARAEQERTRRALIDAEIEMQRGANKMAALEQQLQAAEAATAQAQSAQQAQRGEIESLRSQLQQTAQHSAVLVSDGASLQRQLSEVQGIAQQAQQEAARAAALEVQVARLSEDLAERDARLAKLKDASEVAVDAAQQQQAASDALLIKLQQRVAELEASLQTSSARAAAAAEVAGAEAAALRAQLAAAQRAKEAAEQEAQRAGAAAQTAAAAAELAQRRLRAAEEERGDLQARLEAAQGAADAQRSRGPTPELVAQKDTEIRALEEVLAQVRVAAQQKDAQLVAMQQERDAAMATAQQTEAGAAKWLSERVSTTAQLQQAQQALRETEAAWEAQRGALEVRLEAAAEERRQLESQAQTLKAQLEETRSNLAAAERQVGSLSRQYGESEAAAQQTKRVEAQVLELLSKVDALKRGLEGREREAAAAREARVMAEQQLLQAQLQLEEAQQQLIQRERDHQATLARLSQPSATAAAVAAAVAASEEMAALQARLREAEEAAAETQQAQQEGAHARAQLERQVAELEELAQARAEDAAARVRLEKQVEELEAVVRSLEGQLVERGEEAQRAQQALEGQLQAAQQQLEAAAGAAARQEELVQHLQSQQQEVLRDVEAQHAQQLAAAEAKQQRLAEQLGAAQRELAETAVTHEQELGRLRAEHEAALAIAAASSGEAAAAEAEQLKEALAKAIAHIEEVQASHQAEVQRIQEAHLSELTALRARYEGELAALRAPLAELAAQQAHRGGWEEDVPSPMRRLLQQRLRQAEEEAAAQVAQAREQVQQDAAAVVRLLQEQHARELDAQHAEHEAQLNALRSGFERQLEEAELRHLAELEEAQGASGLAQDALGGSAAQQASQLAARVHVLEAQRVQQEMEIADLKAQLAVLEAIQQQLREGEARGAALQTQLEEVDRRREEAEQEAARLREVLQEKEADLARRLADAKADHEAQLAAVMVKQALLAEELEGSGRRGQKDDERLEDAVREAREEAAAAERARHAAEIEALNAQHAADVAALLANLIFRNLLRGGGGEGGGGATSPPPALPPAEGGGGGGGLNASLNSSGLRRAFRECSDMHWLCGQDTLPDPFSQPPSLAGTPANALGGSPRQSVASSPTRAPNALHCRITAAAASSAGASPSGEGGGAAASRTGGARRSLNLGGGAEGTGARGTPRGGAATAAEAARLAMMLEEALAEVERRTASLEECQDMLAELQAFSQTKKDQVTQLCTELEAQHASTRDALSRLRAAEAQLLQSQAEVAQLNSKSDKYERKCRQLAAEQQKLRRELEERDRRCAELSGQLAAALTSHSQALERLEALAAALARAEREKAQAEAALSEAQRELAAVQERERAGRADKGVQALLQELLSAQQSLRGEASRPPSGLSNEEAQDVGPRQPRRHGSEAAEQPGQVPAPKRRSNEAAEAPASRRISSEPAELLGPLAEGSLPQDTPRLGTEGSEIWSEPGVEGLGPKKRRGALHKLAKMLRGGKRSGSQEGEGDQIPALHRVDSRELAPATEPRQPQGLSHLGPPLGEESWERRLGPRPRGPLLSMEQEELEHQPVVAEAVAGPPRRRDWRLMTLLQEEAQQQAAALQQQLAGPEPQQLWLLGGEAAGADGAMPHPEALPPALRGQPPRAQAAGREGLSSSAELPGGREQGQEQHRGSGNAARPLVTQRVGVQVDPGMAPFEEGPSSWEGQKAQYVLYSGGPEGASAGTGGRGGASSLPGWEPRGKRALAERCHDDTAEAEAPRPASRPGSGLSEPPSPGAAQYYRAATRQQQQQQQQQSQLPARYPGQAAALLSGGPVLHSNALFEA